jgi:hypothetical protein
LVLVNFHRFLNSPEIIQAVAKQILAGKNNRTFLVILSPLVQIPPELEKQILVVEHELPTREQVENIFSSICTGDSEAEFPGGNERKSILDAAAGLTRYEAEGAASLSLVRHGRITAEAIWELKSQMLKKSGLLSLHRGSESFSGLGGLDAMKSFCLRAMRCQGHRDPLPVVFPPSPNPLEATGRDTPWARCPVWVAGQDPRHLGQGFLPDPGAGQEVRQVPVLSRLPSGAV